MDDQTRSKKYPTSKYKNAIFIISVISILVGGLMLALYFVTKYQPLLLLSLVEFLPIMVNLVLLFPVRIKDKNKQEITEDIKTDKEQNETSDQQEINGHKKPVNLPDKHKKERTSFSVFYNKHRAVILSLLIFAIICGINVAMWFSVGYTDTKSMTYFVPVAIILTWVAFLVMERYCRHLKEEAEDPDDESRYNLSLISGLKGAMIINMTGHVVAFVGSVINIMGVGKSTIVINILLAILFSYETLFLIFSLIVRLIRKEMNTTPTMSIPIPGMKGEDLSVIDYLENNTGISMRSLWSIKLIKRVLPYAFVGILVLCYGFSGIVNIDAHQQGVHYRFGKIQDDLLMPGLHLTLPWGIDSVQVYDTEVVNKMTIGYSSKQNEDNMWTEYHDGEEYNLLLGGGKELVCINLRLEYKITDLKAYIESSESPESILQAQAYETITERTIGTDVETLLASDRAKLSEELSEEITRRAERYKTGLTIVSVVLESIHPPVRVADVYQAIISAGIEAEQIIIDAKANAEVLLNEANTIKDSTIAIEEQFRFESMAEAQAVVKEFMASVEADNEYHDNYRYTKYIKALSEAYGNGKIIIVGEGIDQKNIYIGNFVAKDSK